MILRYFLLVPAALAAALVAVAGEPPTSPQLDIKVMLQGSSARELRQLVEEHHGIVTHDLPIIDAVGAKLSAQALDQILLSPLVQRHIDEISLSEQPEPDSSSKNEKCDVGGALELHVDGTSVRWKLYNKNPEPAKMQRLELSWPKALGQLESLRLGKQSLPLPSGPASGPKREIVLEFEAGTYPELAVISDLQIKFGTAPALEGTDAIQQKDFSIEALFVGDCTSKLIPGYSANHENTYYPTVVGADSLHSHGVTGEGVTVAIIDSGLWEHPTLRENTRGEDRIIARYDAITNKTGDEVFDESGHGTHMASILAQSAPVTRNGMPTRSYKGVAPDVNLIAVKAFNIEGQGDYLDIVRAIQFVVDNRETYDIKVLNLSFASMPRWRYWLDPINQAVMRAWASGITVVAAAGNEGPGHMTIGSPGNLPYVITVGALTDSWTLDTRDDDYIPDFSSRGPTPDAHLKPDIVAPGGHMTGLTRPGSTLTKLNPEYALRTGEYVMTGSSQASALVSGIVALLLQLEPDLSPDDIKCMLISSAEVAINRDGLLAYSPFQQGYGYVSATRAITLGQRGCGNTGLDIQKDISGTEHFEGPAIIDQAGETSLPGLAEMLSPEKPEKGLSASRKWGAKSHIERPGYIETKHEGTPRNSFDWESIYLDEKSRIEKLAEESAQELNSPK